MINLKMVTKLLILSSFMVAGCEEERSLWPKMQSLEANWQKLEVKRINPDTIFFHLHDTIGDLSFFGRSGLIVESLDTISFKLQGGKTLSPLFILTGSQPYESLQIIKSDFGIPIGLKAGEMVGTDTVLFSFQKLYEIDDEDLGITWIFSGKSPLMTGEEFWFIVNKDYGVQGIWSMNMDISQIDSSLFYNIVTGIGCFPSIDIIDSIEILGKSNWQVCPD